LQFEFDSAGIKHLALSPASSVSDSRDSASAVGRALSEGQL
jgi:hypothetical protein